MLKITLFSPRRKRDVIIHFGNSLNVFITGHFTIGSHVVTSNHDAVLVKNTDNGSTADDGLAKGGNGLGVGGGREWEVTGNVFGVCLGCIGVFRCLRKGSSFSNLFYYIKSLNVLYRFKL